MTRRPVVVLNYLLAALILFLPGENANAQTHTQTNNSSNSISTSTKNQSQTLSKSHTKENTAQLVDITAVSTDNPQAAVKTIPLNKPRKTIKCDVFIAGGGLGGVAAAIKIWQLNEKNKCSGKCPLHVVLSEETDWLGGQATAQGVSALDENYLVETTGCTANYQKLRHAIRNNYKSNHQLTPEALEHKYLNPGHCWVTRLAFEPKVALEEIDTLLTPAFTDSSLKVLYRHKPFYAKHRRQFFPFASKTPPVKAIYLSNLNTGEQIAVRAKIFLDATECGDLLALANVPYRTGSESKEQTGEPHAPDKANPENVQDYTYPFAVELRPGENHTINKPPLYDDLLQQGKFSFDKFKMFAETQRDTPEGQQVLKPFWTYRRLIDANNFTGGDYPSDFPHDIAMINWSGNDVRGKNFIDKPANVEAEYLAFGKLVSLGFLYWLQTEAPRDEGGDESGKGYPELALRPDTMGTHDGLSKHPYIRESRRAWTKYTVVEQDIAAVSNLNRRARYFSDSTGIGLYPIDIHGHEEIPGAGQAAKPFQIPLGSLIPKKYNAVLPACKNIGVTHITNGAYRLHPIEWAIGEAQGALSHYCLIHKVNPEEVFAHLSLLRDFQRTLIESGTPIYWFNDVTPEHPAFAAAQYLAIAEIMPGDDKHLHFYPDKEIAQSDIDYALTKLSKHIDAQNLLTEFTATQQGPITRAQFAIWLYTIAKSRNLFSKF